MPSSMNWVDGPGGGTPMSAANLDKLAVTADVGTAGTPTGDALRAAYGLSVAATATADATLAVNKHVPVDATAAARTMTLPTGQSEGARIIVEKFDASTNKVTVSGSIRGAAGTISLAWQYETIELVADSSGSWHPMAGHKTKSSLDAAYGPVVPSVLTAGLLWIFGGDSITNGSTASNSTLSFPVQALVMVGGLVARRDSIEAGTPGETSAQLLARLAGQAAQYGAQGTVVMIGTNDAASAVPLATTAANITAIVKAAKQYGPVVLCTIPPRGTSATTAIKTAAAAINAWIRLVGPSLGCWVADVNVVLADSTTGDYASGYDSGDAIHPNTAGHEKIAQVVAATMKKAISRSEPYGLITGIGQGVITLDPLNARATVLSSGWSEQSGGTGTAPTYTMVTDTSGRLPAGRWAQMDFDATASGGTRRLSTSTTTGYTVGDLVLHCAHMQIEDVSGDWEAKVAAGTAFARMQILDQNGLAITGGLAVDVSPGMRNPATGFYDLGPIAFPTTVPAGVTRIICWYSLCLPTGSHAKMRVGAQGLINSTTLGLQPVASYGTSMVNL